MDQQTDVNVFRVRYSSGLSEDVRTTDQSVEAFANAHFGSTWEEAQAMGATVEMNPAPEAPVVETTEGAEEGHEDGQTGDDFEM